MSAQLHNGPVSLCHEIKQRYSHIFSLCLFNQETVHTVFFQASAFYTDHTLQRFQFAFQGLLRRRNSNAQHTGSIHLLHQCIRFAVCNQFALINDDNPLTDRLNFRENMRRQNDCLLFAQLCNQIADFNDLLGIKTHHGFIQNQQWRISQQRLCNTYALLVSFGQILDQTRPDMFDSYKGANFFQMFFPRKRCFF